MSHWVGVIASFALMAGAAMGQSTLTWDGVGGSGVANTVNTADWNALSSNNNHSNWNAANRPASGDSLIFAGTVRLANNNDTTIGNTYNITFNNTAGAFTLSGNRVTVGTGGIINNDVDLQTINLPLTLTSTSGAINTASGNITTGGIIDGTGGILTKTGSNTLTLSNTTNTYTGTTLISAGTLALTGSASIANSPSIVVNAGLNVSGLNSTFTVGSTQTLSGGGGTITGNAAISGTLAPSSSLTFANNLAFNNVSIFSWDLSAGPTDPGANTANSGTFDTVAVNGSLTGTGAVFNIVSAGGFTSPFWDTNKSWSDIFTGGSFNLASIFSSFSGAGVSSTGLVAGQGSFSFSGSTLNWSAIPEPSTALAGVLLAAGLLRRQRNAAELARA